MFVAITFFANFITKPWSITSVISKAVLPQDTSLPTYFFSSNVPLISSFLIVSDFYWPALSHIGEQAVLNKEIYAQGTSADDDVFGYQERYAEYRYKPSIISGLFRTNATGTLDSWHLAQDFASLPVLNSAFIQENAPMARIKAVSAQPDFIFDSNIRLNCARPMPVYSVPGLVDHF